jgi:hypothetical protein
MTASRRPRLAHLGLLLVIGVFAGQQVVAAAGLTVGAAVPGPVRAPVADHLVGALAEIGYFVGVWMYIAAISDPGKGLPAWTYLVLLLGG